jgi:Flp pilus assembly protein TadB
MSAVVATVVAALSALAALASAFLYLYYGRRSERATAREEALALAETRRQVIGELRGRVEALERRHRRTKANCERRVGELQAALHRTRTQAREDAYRTQHFHAAALNDLLGDLERIPPDVEAAIVRIRRLLAGERQQPKRPSYPA